MEQLIMSELQKRNKTVKHAGLEKYRIYCSYRGALAKKKHEITNGLPAPRSVQTLPGSLTGLKYLSGRSLASYLVVVCTS
jgi:hypothetical protein